MWDKIQFFQSLSEYPFDKYADSVLHILCTAGNMSFSFQDVRYNVVPSDYVILTNPVLASGFSESDDFDAVIMSLSEAFVTSMAIQSNYGIIGHMALLQNPVMKLSHHDYRICLEDMWKLRERLNESQHLFREEMLGHLLLVHVLDRPRVLRFSALYHSALSDRSLQEGKRQACYVLDRPLCDP